MASDAHRRGIELACEWLRERGLQPLLDQQLILMTSADTARALFPDVLGIIDNETISVIEVGGIGVWFSVLHPILPVYHWPARGYERHHTSSSLPPEFVADTPHLLGECYECYPLNHSNNCTLAGFSRRGAKMSLVRS